MVSFLAAFDNIIVASNTPLIATGKNEKKKRERLWNDDVFIEVEFSGYGLYNWVNTASKREHKPSLKLNRSKQAFLLTASTSQPIYAKSVDIFGRRGCFLVATGFYLIGSILCGAAQSMIMLIVARALCGLGIGAFDTLMKIVVAGNRPGSFSQAHLSDRLHTRSIHWNLSIHVGNILGIGLCCRCPCR